MTPLTDENERDRVAAYIEALKREMKVWVDLCETGSPRSFEQDCEFSLDAAQDRKDRQMTELATDTAEGCEIDLGDHPYKAVHDFIGQHGDGIFIGNYSVPSRARLCIHWHEPPGERVEGEVWICTAPRDQTPREGGGVFVWRAMNSGARNGQWVRL